MNEAAETNLNGEQPLSQISEESASEGNVSKISSL